MTAEDFLAEPLPAQAAANDFNIDQLRGYMKLLGSGSVSNSGTLTQGVDHAAGGPC